MSNPAPLPRTKWDAPGRHSAELDSWRRLATMLGIVSRADSRMVERQPIEYREWLRDVSADHYAVKMQDVLEPFRQEWVALLAFKTGLFGGAGSNKKKPSGNTRWRVRCGDVSPKLGGWVDTVRGKSCPTAGITFSMVCQFFGWLQLGADRGGLGLYPEKAKSLGNLANVDYVRTYTDWRIERSRGRITGSITKILISVRSLCHPSQGFLITRPDIGARVGIVEEQQWRTHCQHAHSEFDVALHNTEPQVSNAFKGSFRANPGHPRT